MNADTIEKFIHEYQNVIRGIVPSATEAQVDEYFHGSKPDYDRTREYWFAARFGNFGLGRVGLEVTHPNSFFSLYAAAYHRRFIVSDLISGHSGRVAWLESMQAAKDVIDIVDFQDLKASFYEGDLISNIFCFRLLENIEDDEILVRRLGELIPSYGCMTLSFAFSHSAPFGYDPVVGFRVYDNERVDWLFRHFEVLNGEAHEAAEMVALAPRAFDMTTYTLTVRKK